MLDANALFFLGLIVVGLGLTARVVTEGSSENTLLRAKLDRFRQTTEACNEKTLEVGEKAQVLAGEVQDLVQELEVIEGRRKHLTKKVGTMKQRLDKTSRGR